MTEPTVVVTLQATRPNHHITFRVLAGAIAALLLIGFGAWLSILTPWTTPGDPVDHGWIRTPELHQLADSASAGLLAALGIAAITLAAIPRGNSAVASWMLAMLTLFGISSFVSAEVQGHELTGAALFLLIWFIVVVGLPWFFAPLRSTLVRGGASASNAPNRGLRTAFGALAIVGVLLAAVAITWRTTGGIFESPREDDVISFVLLGIALALGGFQCAQAREGWRTLGITLAGLAGYAVVAGISIILI